jgi:uncharacterized membrane protein
LIKNVQRFSMASLKARFDDPYRIAGFLFVFALLLRAYRLTSNPLWLDELYGYQLSQLGTGAIIRNSSYVPHPPLYYLLLHITSGFGAFYNVWAWRWLSVIIGAGSVALIYHLAKGYTTRLAAFLSSLLFTISPTHIYYSQEARPYAFLICLTIVTAWLLQRMSEFPQERALWIGFTGLSIWGIWSSYSYLMVVGTQLLYLVMTLRNWRYLSICAGTIFLSCLPLVTISVRTLGETHAAYVGSAAMTITLLAQALLAGDPLRYGFSWVHIWAPIGLGLLVLLGLVRALPPRGKQGSLYHVTQVILPVLTFFAVATPLLNIRLPSFEWRQFLVLLPSVFVLIALGIDQLWEQRFTWMSRMVVLGVCLLAVYASTASLLRYWTITKSPEGLAALFVQEHVERDDAIVSFHYSLDAALSFYVPDRDVFTKPDASSNTLLFARSSSILPEMQRTMVHDATVDTIRRHPRIWLLFQIPPNADMIRALTEPCTPVRTQDVPPFQVLLVHQCQ